MSHRFNSSGDRSRERYHGYRGRSESSNDSYEKKKKKEKSERRHTYNKPVQTHQKHVTYTTQKYRFQEEDDIKVFKKDDEPNGKGMTDEEVQEYMNKLELERGAGSFNKMNWENMRHKDAQFEQNSIRQVNNAIKQEKQRFKALNEKLEMVRAEAEFYTPVPLIIHGRQTNSLQDGVNSNQRDALTSRLKDVLSCLYVQESQIPAEPDFSISNTSSSSQPQNIVFDRHVVEPNSNDSIRKQKESKPLKGILKTSLLVSEQTEPRQIDPKLIMLMKEITSNKSKYSKDQLQSLLAPYKATGQLAYVLSNKQILNQVQTPPIQTDVPSVPFQSFPPNQYHKGTHPSNYYNISRNSYSSERNPNQFPHMKNVSQDESFRNPSPIPTNPPGLNSKQMNSIHSPSPIQGPGGMNHPNNKMGFYPMQRNSNQRNQAYRPNPYYHGNPSANGNPGFNRSSEYGGAHGGPPAFNGMPGYANPQMNQPFKMGGYSHTNPSTNPLPHDNNMRYKVPNNNTNGMNNFNMQLEQQKQNEGHQMGVSPNFAVNLNRNFKTVPCKYFHSTQGCLKADKCTFIHEQQYAGRPTPSMLRLNTNEPSSFGTNNDGFRNFMYPHPPP